jgi:aldose 1-epimerase
MRKIETALLQNSTSKVQLLNMGCITQSWQLANWTADRSAVIGYARAADYKNNPHFLGAVIGRVANRVEGANFTLDGKVYTLDANDGSHTLHGGTGGLADAIWDMDIDGQHAVQFRMKSKHLELGFPGDVDFVVTVSLHANTLIYNMFASVSEPTPINMTQHNYYNLRGFGTIDNHRLHIPSSKALDTDASGIPLQVIDLAASELDFQSARVLNTDRDVGLDANYCLDTKTALAISLNCGTTSLTLNTTQAGLQVYTAGKLNSLGQPFGMQTHEPFCGICLEPQGYPNAVNRPDFPSIIVTPDLPYQNTLAVKLADSTVS